MWSGTEPKNMNKELMRRIEESAKMTTAWKEKKRKKNIELYVIWRQSVLCSWFCYLYMCHHNDTFKNARLILDFELYGSWMMAV